MKKIFKSIIGLIGTFGFLIISPVSIFAATLSFDPAAGVVNKGCEISIKVTLDTQGVQTDGTDVIVLYAPAQLSTSTSQILNGTIYPEYPGNSVDATGKISISGISSVSNPYSGTGTFATIKFNVASTLKENDKINLDFDFDANNKTKTTDTNVVERGTIADVLSAVTDGSYTVGTGACTGNVTNSQTSSGTGTSGSGTTGGSTIGGQGQTLPGTTSASQSAQYQVYKPNLNDLTGDGRASGILDNTILITAVGVILVIAGIAGLALL